MSWALKPLARIYTSMPDWRPLHPVDEPSVAEREAAEVMADPSCHPWELVELAEDVMGEASRLRVEPIESIGAEHRWFDDDASD